MVKRCAISFFFDENGILDDYICYLLEHMRPHVGHIILVVNGSLTEASEQAARRISDELIMRPNVGFDVWAYKDGLTHIGESGLDRFDEVLLFNHTFYGPIYPFSELFAKMEATACDFWGISAHKAMTEATPDGDRHIDFHLNSHFIAVRQPMLSSDAFKAYWRDMPFINSYRESIELHELKFTKHFQDLGYRCGVYVNPEDFGSAYSAFMEVDATIAARSPILKRRIFFHDPAFLEERAVDLPRALRIIEQDTSYPINLIWQNILRSTPARVLYTNAAMLRILPDSGKATPGFKSSLKIAVCVHAHYADLIDEILDRTAFIPIPYDLIVTTDSQEKKKSIELAAAKRKGISQTIVRLLKEIRGRDMSSLLVTCGDLFLDDRYDLVCRVHTKKSPQVEASRGNYFKRFMLDNTLSSPAFVEHVIQLFENDQRLGLAMPPMIHYSTPTLGHAWFVNRENALKVAAKLDLKVPIDEGTPLATYGGTFWFRPKALRKLFNAFDYADFPREPAPVDGSLAHALERLFVYVAQDAGFFSLAIAAPGALAQAYTSLEFKADKLASLLPNGLLRDQVDLLGSLRPVLRAASQGTTTKEYSLQDNLRLLESRLAQIDEESQSHAARARHLQLRMMRTFQRFGKNPLAGLASLATPSGFGSEYNTIKKYIKDIYMKTGVGQRSTSRSELADYTLGSYLDGNDLLYFFDSRFYLQANRDVAESGTHPLVHFLRHGWREGRSPHPLIDTKYLRSKRPDVAEPASLPLADFLLDKSASPHILFDTTYYVAQLDDGELTTLGPLEHFLKIGAARGLDPHPLFDTDFYSAHSPELVKFNVNPLVHYLRYGAREGRDPCPLFSTRTYAKFNPDVLSSGDNPLVHYLRHGLFERRKGGLSSVEAARIQKWLAGNEPFDPGPIGRS